MSETENAPAVEAAPDEAPAQEIDWKAKFEETQAHSRKWEERAKANAEAAKRLTEIEEASKSDAQRQAEAVEKANAELAETRAQLERISLEKVRAEVANEKGVPAHLLVGSSQDELEASADALIAFRGEQKAAPASPAVGRVNPQSLALNGDGIENALRTALGIHS